MQETVEQFMARGGKIKEVPFGQGSNQIKLKRSKGSVSRTVQVDGERYNYNKAVRKK